MVVVTIVVEIRLISACPRRERGPYDLRWTVFIRTDQLSVADIRLCARAEQRQHRFEQACLFRNREDPVLQCETELEMHSWKDLQKQNRNRIFCRLAVRRAVFYSGGASSKGFSRRYFIIYLACPNPHTKLCFSIFSTA